jgi:DMSO/TMAO reductase YedYZ heme-binding membrane subunit
LNSALCCILLLFAITLFPDALPAAGNIWDWLGGIGLVAMGFLLSLCWEAESPARQPRLNVHRNLAMAALTLSTLHGVGYLVTDPISIEYLKPTAPLHMLIGIIGFMLLLLLTLTSLAGPRRRLYAGFRSFRRWHIWMSIAVVATAFWHVLGTGYLINGVPRTGLFTLFALAAPAIAYLLRRQGIPTAISSAPVSPAAADREVALIMLIGLLLSCLYSAIRNS